MDNSKRKKTESKKQFEAVPAEYGEKKFDGTTSLEKGTMMKPLMPGRCYNLKRINACVASQLCLL